MSKGDYYKDRQHRATLASKYERLEGLRALYATYEQFGHEPLPRSEMADLRRRIAVTKNQIKAMDDILEK